MRITPNNIYRTTAATFLFSILLGGCATRPGSAPGGGPGTVQTHNEGADPVGPNGKAVRATAVTIDQFAYAPKSIEIDAGAMVTWTNRDDVPHTATSSASPRAFDSGTLDTDQSFSFTFAQPGTYPYFCAVHPHMTGTVIVRARATTATGAAIAAPSRSNHVMENEP